MKLTKEELFDRQNRFVKHMSNSHPDWDTAVIIGKINQYYYTGTMQDGILVIRKDGSVLYFVRRSYERAKLESPIDSIYPMESYRDAVQIAGESWGNTYLETEIVTVGIIQRLQKYFGMKSIQSLDQDILELRAVKSPYELYYIEESGRQHQYVLANIVPDLLREGMSEAELVGKLYEKMVEHGYHGVSRFAMFQIEMVAGQIGFGESSLYPTSFDGPGGAYGGSAAVPVLGSRERKLRKGDLVFVDVGFGINGYHSDKTQVYMYGVKPSLTIQNHHRTCMNIQSQLASLLKPGAIPSQVYESVMQSVDSSFLPDFMGFGARSVKFFGHGVGLVIDEWPVIAKGFNKPLQENMVIALEPKKGIAGIGMVGVEDTYLVTPTGGRCITGGGRDIVVVDEK